MQITAPINVSRAFLLFMSFGGSLEQVAVAMSCPLAALKELAAREGWAEHLAAVGGQAGDGNRAQQILVNQTVNYVQAHRARGLVDTVLDYVREKAATADGIEELFMVPGKDGRSFSTRPLTDLIKAAETCQLMTERALAQGKDGAAPVGQDELYLSVMKAMEAAEGVGLSSSEVVKKQLDVPTVARRSLRAAIGAK